MFSLYVHIPFCLKKCNYCDFFSITDLTLESDFLKAILMEIKQKANFYNLKQQQIKTIYFGGGTPSILSISTIENILNQISKFFDTTNVKEVTIECNPGTINLDFLKNLKQIGFNRISLGTQSFRDEELKLLGRIHNAKQNFEAIDLVRKAGFENLSIDLIYSIPNQTLKNLSESIDQTLQVHPQHISTYCLSYPPKTPIHSLFKKKEITKHPKKEEAKFYKLISKTLRQNNYIHYEISNFCIKNFHCQHNVNYWKRKEYLGFGPSAYSFFNNIRSKNTNSLLKYLSQKNFCKNSWQEKLNTLESIYEFIFLGLRFRGIDYKLFNKLFKLDFGNVYSDLISKLIQNNFGIIKNSKFKLTLKGYTVCNRIAVEFLKLTDNYFQHIKNQR